MELRRVFYILRRISIKFFKFNGFKFAKFRAYPVITQRRFAVRIEPKTTALRSKFTRLYFLQIRAQAKHP